MKRLSLLLNCFVSLFLLSGPISSAQPDQETTITVCVEDRFWPIGSFFYKGHATGTHVDVVRAAVEQLSLKVAFIRMPWKRCLSGVGSGDIDAILSASYRKEREAFLYFPDDATATEPHPKSLEYVEFVLVTRSETPVKTLDPIEPIGVPLGYMSADIFREAGLDVVQLMNHKDLWGLLERGRVNSIMMSKPLVDFYMMQTTYSARFKQTKMPGRSGPLFLAFSRKGHIPKEQVDTIWNSIEQVHQNTSLMNRITGEAQKKAEECLKVPLYCD